MNPDDLCTSFIDCPYESYEDRISRQGDWKSLYFLRHDSFHPDGSGDVVAFRVVRMHVERVQVIERGGASTDLMDMQSARERWKELFDQGYRPSDAVPPFISEMKQEVKKNKYEYKKHEKHEYDYIQKYGNKELVYEHLKSMMKDAEKAYEYTNNYALEA